MDLIYFVLLVGALVLVHELGHFAAARIFGVRVVTFSLGFGPTLLRYRGRETTYQIALFPFGGFVRLLEEEPPRAAHGRPSSERGHPGDAVGERRSPPSRPAPSSQALTRERSRAYEAQPAHRRALIALAGPTMNMVFPLFLFFAVFLDPGEVAPPTIGLVTPGTPADGALREGDRVVAVDGETIETYGQLQARVAASPGRTLLLTVRRIAEASTSRGPTGGKPGGAPPSRQVEETREIAVTPRAVTEPRDFGATAIVGRLGIRPAPLAAAIGIVSPDSSAYRAGLRTFDVVTHVRGRPTPTLAELARVLRDNVGTAVPIDILRPSSTPLPGERPLLELTAYEARVVVVAPEAMSGFDQGRSAGGDVDDATSGLERLGVESLDLYVASVPEGSSEWRAGLRPGDRITGLDGAPARSWQSFAEDLVAGGETTREVHWRRDGHPMSGLLRVRKEEWVDAAGAHVERYVWRTSHWTPSAPAPLIAEPAPLRRAARLAFAETAQVVRFLVTGAVRLVQGRLAVESISGPITIYDVAGRAGARGARDFLWVMALISINLGLLNLLPIPTLDGGQFLFIGLESALRRPVPMRVREAMSIAGLGLLVLLMLVAFRNDLGRHWPSIMAPVRQIFG